MRIVIATPIYPPEAGGPATYTVEIARRLARAHEVVVVAYAEHPDAIPGIKLVAVSKKHLLPIRLIKYFFVLLHEAKKADIIYVQNAVAAGLPAVLVGTWLKKPVVLKFVGDEAWERATQAGKTKKQLEEFLKYPDDGLRTTALIAVQRFVLRRAAIVTTPSAYLAELAVIYYGVKKVRTAVNYNAIEIPTMEPVVRKPYQVMTAVRLVSWKGVAGIIRATSLLKGKFPDLRFIVAGDGPERQKLEELTRTSDLTKYVVFLGRISRQDVLVLQSSSTLQVLNSSYEGLPHGVLESFATGTPLIATNIPGTSEAVYHEDTGLLVPLNDNHALAAAIERLFVDQNLRARLADAGAKILKEKFSWEVHIAELHKMFAKAQSL